MGKSGRGDPGQAGTYDPKEGGRFEPGTKAQPPAHPHEHDDNKADSGGPAAPGRPGRPRPK